MAIDIYTAKSFDEKVSEIIDKIGTINYNVNKAKLKLEE